MLEGNKAGRTASRGRRLWMEERPGMKRLVVIFTLLLTGALAGCGGSGNGISGSTPTISITVAPTSATLDPGGTASFTATVMPSTANQSVTWALSGTGCTGSGCGTLSSATANPTTYTAPATAPSPNTVAITVTSVGDPTKSASAVITVTNQLPVEVAVTPAAASIVAGAAAQQFTATVSNSPSDESVTWSLSGTGCSGDACGTIDSSTANPVTYTPPGTPVTPGPVLLTATSNADPTKSGTASISVLASTTALLNGSYAFHLKGFTSVGLPLGISGSFLADGNGNITGGTEDVNTNGSVNTYSNLAGTYTISSTLQGSFTLTSVPGAPTYSMVVNNGGTKGTLVELDSSNDVASGEFMQQTVSDFSLGTIAGNFAFEASGNDVATGRTAAAGHFNLSPAGVLSGGVVDVAATGGVNLSNASVTGSVTAPDATGRGTAQLTFGGGSTFNLAVYVVNRTRLLLLDVDSASAGNPLLAGEADTQATGLDNTAFNSPSVFWATGLSSASPAPSAIIGTFTGSSTTLTITGSLDENDGGTLTHVTAATGSFSSVSSSTGRGTLLFMDGGTTVLRAVFYLTAPETGFLVENSATANEARVGNFVPQTGGPFSSTSLAGNFTARAVGGSTADVPVFSALAAVDNTSDVFTINGDIASLSGSQQAATGSGSFDNVLTDGRANTVLPSAFFNSANGILYIVSPSQSVVIGDDTGSHSSVTIMTQQ
jgi:hypothetical protein